VNIQKLASLSGYYWQLDSMSYTNGEASSVLAGTSYILSFESNESVKGKKACNKISGNYSASGNTLGFNNIESTTNDCTHTDQETLDNQIAFFENTVTGAASYQTGANTLKIISSDARELNFHGIQKQDQCKLTSTDFPTNNFNMCVLSCTASTQSTMSCFGQMITKQCEMYCSVN